MDQPIIVYCIKYCLYDKSKPPRYNEYIKTNDFKHFVIERDGVMNDFNITQYSDDVTKQEALLSKLRKLQTLWQNKLNRLIYQQWLIKQVIIDDIATLITISNYLFAYRYFSHYPYKSELRYTKIKIKINISL